MVILLSLCATIQSSGQPNVILILADDQSWNGTSVQMDPNVPSSASDFYQTPSLEALAAEGMRFSNAYSAASICSPTRAALQTGRSPAQVGMTDITKPQGVRFFDGYPLTPPQWREIDTHLETLADRVEAANGDYVTAHIGKWHLEPDPTFLGYDIGFNPVRAPGVGSEDPGSVFAKTDAALSFLDDRKAANEPFFLQLSHFAVHTPIEGQAALIDKYENLPPGTVHSKPKFAAFTEALDTGVGMVLDRVRDLDLDDNTYIIYASDNGARDVDSANFPLTGSKAHLHEGGIRTPLIIKGPGIQADSASSVPVTTVDLYSTVSDLVGNTSPFQDGVEGASLLPILENNGQLPAGVEHLERQYSEGGAIFFTQPHNFPAGTATRSRPMSAARKEDFKLLRIHGENGQPDRDLLFNFSNSFTETESAGTGTDIASDNPETTRELAALLDNWFEKTDVSLAYDVAAPVNLTWAASQNFDSSDRWRSVEDVKQRWRETWESSNPASDPQVVDTQAHQPGLAYKAIRFDGNDGMFRRIFHVSNSIDRNENRTHPTGVADFDRSVSFETWVRFDDIRDEHHILENGVSTRGLSITLGDADGDGKKNDLRFRLLDEDDRHITVTTAIDAFANVTRDFAQIVTVFNDDPDNRYAEIFVNGHSLAKIDGTEGEVGSIMWDGFWTGFRISSLGANYETSFGTASGSGELPFTGGNLRGDLASFRFANKAWTAEDVQNAYASRLTASDLGVISAVGDVALAGRRPVSIAEGDFELDAVLQVIHERRDILDDALMVDVLAAPGTASTIGGMNQLAEGILPDNTQYSSYLFHFDSASDSPGFENLTGSITFLEPMLGLLIDEDSLDATELLFNVAGEFAQGDRAISPNGLGLFTLSEDLRTLSYELNVSSDSLTQFRVLTAPAIGGDYDQDGDVDEADYLIWKAELGTTGSSPADGNFDGVVDVADYTIWRDDLGSKILGRAGTIRGGDYNGDGLINLEDYAVWRAAFGTVGPSLADGNQDGIVDAADYTVWRNNLLSSQFAVPEPASATLILLMLAISTFSGRKLI